MTDSVFTQAEVDALLAPMACGHPKACWEPPEPYIGDKVQFQFGVPAARNDIGHCAACAKQDALVATELALFAQKACEVVKRESNFASFHAVVCERILALAYPNALQEHDAALRARQLELQDEIDVFVRKQAELREQLTHLQTGCAEWKGKAKKLEAENAELRSEVDLFKRRLNTSEELRTGLANALNEARALLAKSGTEGKS